MQRSASPPVFPQRWQKGVKTLICQVFCAEKIGNALSLKVPRFCNAEPFTKSGTIYLPQQPNDFLRGKYVVFSLLAVAVRVLAL